MNAPVSTPLGHPVAELFAEDGDFVFRTLRYLGVAPSSLDDALQDVFVTAYRRWSTFEGRSSARSWLYGIARRIAFRYRRNSKTQSERFLLESVEGEERPFDRLAARRSVSQLVAALDEPKRAAFILVEVEGLTAPEAAGVLGVPVGTVYSRVRAAWKVLRTEANADDAVVGAIAARPKLSRDRRSSLERGIAAACLGKVAVPAALTVAWAGVGIALGGVALGGLLWISGTAPTGPADQREVQREDQRKGQRPASLEPGGRVDRASAQGGAVPTSAPTDQVESAAAPDQESVGPTLARPRPEPPRAREAATPTERSKSAEALPARSPTQPTTLAAELAIMRAVQAAIRRGDHDAARKALAEHARRFPDGQLLEDRKVALKKVAGVEAVPRRVAP